MYIFRQNSVKQAKLLNINVWQFPLKIILQEQQQLLSVYQNLVVKQLVSQSKKQEEVDQSEEQDEEARSVRNELVVLTPQVKDLVLAQKKTAGTDD